MSLIGQCAQIFRMYNILNLAQEGSVSVCVVTGAADRNPGAPGNGDEVLPQCVVCNQRHNDSIQQETHQPYWPGPQHAGPQVSQVSYRSRAAYHMWVFPVAAGRTVLKPRQFKWNSGIYGNRWWTAGDAKHTWCHCCKQASCVFTQCVLHKTYFVVFGEQDLTWQFFLLSCSCFEDDEPPCAEEIEYSGGCPTLKGSDLDSDIDSNMAHVDEDDKEHSAQKHQQDSISQSQQSSIKNHLFPPQTWQPSVDTPSERRDLRNGLSIAKWKITS